MTRLPSQLSQRVFTPLQDRGSNGFPVRNIIQAVGHSVLTRIWWPYPAVESRLSAVVMRGVHHGGVVLTGTQQRVGQPLVTIREPAHA